MAVRLNGDAMARTMAAFIGQEVLLARTDLALTRRTAARLARVSPQTQERVERGDPSVGLHTVCRVAAGVGLKVWAKAFPAQQPSLRDTGQLRIAEWLRRVVSPACNVALEVPVGSERSADMVLYAPTEIVHIEIERRLADWQEQIRRAQVKRDQLAHRHERPVRLVMAVEDIGSNQALARDHATVLRAMLPAASREVARALRIGTPLGRDGILWVRPRDAR